MKITPGLLKKYAAGDCTETERLQVEQWLSDNEDLSTSLPGQKLEQERTRVWQNISGTVKPATETIPLYKKSIRHVAAACIAIVFFAIGYFVATFHAPMPTASTLPPTQNELQITAENGQTTKIAGNRFNVSFSGVLQLYNASTTTTMVTCGNKTFELEPMDLYYLKGSDDKASIFSVSDLAIQKDFSHFLSGDFSVHRIAI